jgi:hypothetical protein
MPTELQKQLAGQEDMLLGQGTVNQDRGGTTYPISKLNGDVIPFSGDTETADLVSVNTAIQLALDLGNAALDTPTYDPAGIEEQVVGVAATQSLTNKTLDDISNTIHANTVHVFARNNTGVDIALGSIVRISGAVGQIPTIALADATSEANSADSIGIATVAIANNAVGDVTLNGIIEGIDTSAFGDGDTVYLSTVPGELVNVKPDTPNHLVVVGRIAYSHAVNGKVFVSISNGWELDELHDVLVTGLTAGEILQRDPTNTFWENKTAAEAKLGGATGGGTDQVFHENDVHMTADYTITTGKNAVVAGPFIIDDTAILTIPDGSAVVVV